MNIEFEELPFTLGGVDVFPLAGNFDVEADGSIGTIWLEEWNAPRNRKPKMIMLDGQSQGLSRLFWLLLPPILRQRYAEEIAEEFESRRKWRPNEHAIGAFEALGRR